MARAIAAELGVRLMRQRGRAGRASDRSGQRELFLVERDHWRPGLGKFVLAQFLEALLIVMVKPTNVRRREMGRIGRHLFCGGEPARPVGFQNVLVQRAEMLELLAPGISLSARKRVNGDRPGLVLEPDMVDFEPGEFRRLVARSRARNDVDAELFRRTLEPGGDVDLVAERRIIEALNRPHITDAAYPGVEANAEFHCVNWAAGLLRPLLPFSVELDQRLAHLERRAHRANPVRRIVERRIPERHDRVAHIFVDGAHLLQDHVGHRRSDIR